MPRKSAEAVSAAYLRAGGQHPKPPKGMQGIAAKIWREIVESRPVDFFGPGSLHLLAILCRMLAVQDRLLAELEASPGDDEVLARAARLAPSITTYATKLRLTIQSASRIGEAKADEQQARLSGLLGGHAVERRLQ